MSVLRDARIVLGVTGGIAAYKAADIASKLVQAGAIVDVVLTEAGSRFVGEATFQALTKRPVHGTVFEPWTDDHMGHISLGHDADAFLIAPATAHAIARLALGLADDMLGAAALSTKAPVVIAPAMEHAMFHHPATQANLDTVRGRGAVVVGPERGRLASGEYGDGRFASPEAILGCMRQVLGRQGRLAGRKVVVSAGGTQEAIDPVRFLGNRSSGRMGYALAQAAIDAGARVTLVTTPTALAAPFGAELITVRSADEMKGALCDAIKDADALLMAAAVADFRPAAPAAAKIKKSGGQGGLTLQLDQNPDILSSISSPRLVKVGFAAETENLVAHARSKLVEKRLDMVVANDAVATIGAEVSTATLLFADGTELSLPMMEKSELAVHTVDHLARLIEGRGGAS